MSIADITEPLARVDRARDHLDTLYEELRTFFEPYRSLDMVYATIEEGWYVLNIKPLREDLPISFSIICGDFVHNLRVALDYLACQLVIREGGEPDRVTSFPICTSIKDFDKRVARPAARKKGPLRRLAIGGDGWTFVESVQPYYSLIGAEGAILSAVSRFDNADKHRALLAKAVVIHPDEFRRLISYDSSVGPIEIAPGESISAERDTKVLYFRFPEARSDPKVDVQDSLVVEPIFGERGSVLVGPSSLGTMYFHVRNIILSCGPSHSDWTSS